MQVILSRLLLALALTLSVGWATAGNEVEGPVQSVDPAMQTFVVEGIRFHVTSRTDWDDGLRSFSDLQPGMKVEVDFIYRDGRHIAVEVERED